MKLDTSVPVSATSITTSSGLDTPKGYYSFDHWEESVIAYRDKVQYKHRDGEGYYSFLKRIGYASAPDYINKVREIASQL